MSAAPLISFDELLAPASGAASTNGDATALSEEQLDELKKKRIAVRDMLKLERKEDPDAQPTPKKANWQIVKETAEKTLREPYKDLQVAAHLTEALTVQHGFAGLRDGLHLMRRIVDECWDRLNPPIEDGDVEPYAAPFHWLDDTDAGALFPNRIRALALIRGKDKKLDYSYLDCRQAQDGRGRMSWEEYQRAVAVTPLSDCEEIASEVDQCVEEAAKLGQSLAARFAAGGAELQSKVGGLTSLKQALQECQNLIQDIVRRKRPEEASGTNTEAGEAGDSSAGAAGSRDAIYQQLRRAADSLQRIEPHSPVPYLIKRAVELGPLPFHQMIRQLIRDANVLDELSRELGIKEEGRPQAPEE